MKEEDLCVCSFSFSFIICQMFICIVYVDDSDCLYS